ncbi:MAG: hypothetical protein AAF962_21110 [Actinomycetota bacterium]
MSIEVAALILSTIAILISLGSLSYSRREALAAEKANERETKEQELREEAARLEELRSKKARIVVRRQLMRTAHGMWYLVAVNQGKATARDVKLNITGTGHGDTNVFDDGGSTAGRGDLISGELWAIPLSVRSENRIFPLEGVLTWQDDSDVSPVEEFSIADFLDSPTLD